MERFRWIDHCRGYLVLHLAIHTFFPILATHFPFIMAHRAGINYYNFGPAVWIFIMGILMPLSFYRRKVTQGNYAYIHFLKRYGILLTIGLFLIYLDRGRFFHGTVAGLPLLEWDVLPTLGLVGLITLPLIMIPALIRGIIAILLLLIYQYLLPLGLNQYALQSIHGGIFGTIFGYSVIMILSTCIGDTILVHKKNHSWFAFFIIAIVFGMLFMTVTGTNPSRLVVDGSYVFFSICISILISLFFIMMDRLWKKKIPILTGLGKNSLFFYAVIVFVDIFLGKLFGGFTLLLGMFSLIGIVLLAIIFEKRSIVLKI